MPEVFKWTQFCFIVTKSIMLFILVEPVVSQLPEVYKFTMADASAHSIFPVSQVHPDVSGSIQCASLCSAAQDCFAYQYNSTQKSCSVGGDVISTGAALDANTRLFVRGYDETISCASNGYAYRECVPSSPAVSVTLSRQLSRSACTSGTSFGLSATGAVWVDQGCRGNFAVRF